MKYISTRGQAPELGFVDVAFAGLASDGGLYLPQSMPHFSAADLERMQNMSYPELAYEVLSPFWQGELAEKEARRMLQETYSQPCFSDAEIAPVKPLLQGEYLLELFHGPTLAFKDFALQFLGRLMEYLLQQQSRQAMVLGATSGDTGSAAIAAFAGRANMKIFILHPHGRTSEIQRRQMTTVLGQSVHNIALQGTFDDCQTIVKALFLQESADQSVARGAHLIAVNSINWVRVMAQVAYYFYAVLRAKLHKNPLNVCVPTGNFGDIFAGHIAKQMGLPLGQLWIATNSNDILARALHSGVYGAKNVVPTLSPSMDIQISSNFERLLYLASNQNALWVRGVMEEFRSAQSFTIPQGVLAALRQEFRAASADDALTRSTMADIYRQTGELLDPHTAVGVAAARALQKDDTPVLILATAHPAKFPAAVEAATGIHPALPAHLADLLQRKEEFDILPNDIAAVKHYIHQH